MEKCPKKRLAMVKGGRLHAASMNNLNYFRMEETYSYRWGIKGHSLLKKFHTLKAIDKRNWPFYSAYQNISCQSLRPLPGLQPPHIGSLQRRFMWTPIRASIWSREHWLKISDNMIYISKRFNQTSENWILLMRLWRRCLLGWGSMISVLKKS
jgi:hypothetical protein